MNSASIDTTIVGMSNIAGTDNIGNLLRLSRSVYTGTPANGFGLGLQFDVEDDSDTTEEQASIHIVLEDVTNDSENAAFVFNQNKCLYSSQLPCTFIFSYAYFILILEVPPPGFGITCSLLELT